MTEFSSCLDRVRLNKNLRVIDIARLMNLDASTVSKWLSGERRPKNHEILYDLLDKLKLSDVDKKLLIESYEKEYIGKEKYECIKLWKEIIQTINTKQTEKKTIPAETQKVITKLQPVENIKGKFEILQTIQNLFDYIIAENIKKLYLRLDTLNKEIMLLLNLFVNKGYECDIDIVMFPKNYVADETVFNLQIVKEMILMWTNNARFQIHISQSVEELNRDENFIITDKFVFQCHQDLSEGFLSTNEAWIKLWINNYKNWSEKCPKMCSLTSMSDIFGRYDYFYKMETSFNLTSWEYMPCLCTGLNEEILRKNLYEFLPEREELIKMTMDIIVNVGEKSQFTPSLINNYCSVKGVYEFMETGDFSALPAKHFYKPLDMGQRITVLERVADKIASGELNPYFIKPESGVIVENAFIEMIEEKKDFIRISLIEDDGLSSLLFDIEDRKLVDSFFEFSDYIKSMKSIYSFDESFEIIKNILNEYKQKYNVN